MAAVIIFALSLHTVYSEIFTGIIFRIIIFHIVYFSSLGTFYYQSTYTGKYFMCLILVGKVKDENILTMKISLSTVVGVRRNGENMQFWLVELIWLLPTSQPN